MKCFKEKKWGNPRALLFWTFKTDESPTLVEDYKTLWSPPEQFIVYISNANICVLEKLDLSSKDFLQCSPLIDIIEVYYKKLTKQFSLSEMQNSKLFEVF